MLISAITLSILTTSSSPALLDLKNTFFAGVFNDFSYQVAALPLEAVSVLNWNKDQNKLKRDEWPERLGEGSNARQLPF